MPNIRFSYLYRDAGNYKNWAEVVFGNAEGLTCENITKVLREAFSPDGLFIAHQVRVPEAFLYVRGDANSDDHCFHEFDCVEVSARTPSDQLSRSIIQFIAEVKKEAKRGWTPFDPHEGSVQLQPTPNRVPRTLRS